VRVDDLLGAALAKVGTAILNQGGVVGAIAGRAPYFLTPILRHRAQPHHVARAAVRRGDRDRHRAALLRRRAREGRRAVVFVPLLIGTGGNAGSQTVSTIIRALALGEVRCATCCA